MCVHSIWDMALLRDISLLDTVYFPQIQTKVLKWGHLVNQNNQSEIFLLLVMAIANSVKCCRVALPLCECIHLLRSTYMNVNRQNSHGTKDGIFCNLPPQVFKTRHLSGSTSSVCLNRHRPARMVFGLVVEFNHNVTLTFKILLIISVVTDARIMTSKCLRAP